MDYHLNVDGLFSSFFTGGCTANFPAISTTNWCNQQLEFNGGIQAPQESELKQTLVQTSVELESARILARQELRQMELQALHLLHLLNTTMQERDEARRLLSNHQQLSAHYLSPKANNVSVQQFNIDEVIVKEGSEESGGNSSPELVQVMETAVKARGLPEKGRLVDAVMSAGPLLQMLLLAGPLPQWQNPPPELRCSDIPPVSIGGSGNLNMTENGDNLVVSTVHKAHCSEGNDIFYQNGMAYFNAR